MKLVDSAGAMLVGIAGAMLVDSSAGAMLVDGSAGKMHIDSGAGKMHIDSAVSKYKVDAKSTEAATNAVFLALKKSARGDELVALRNPRAANDAYRQAFDALTSALGALLDPKGPARRAVVSRFPDFDLAGLFDHIKSARKATAQASATQCDAFSLNEKTPPSV